MKKRIATITALLFGSVNGWDATSVDGQNTTRCFNPGSAACTISGFNMITGKAEGTGFGNRGGGINCYYSPTPVITNCTLLGNSAAPTGFVTETTAARNWMAYSGGILQLMGISFFLIFRIADR